MAGMDVLMPLDSYAKGKTIFGWATKSYTKSRLSMYNRVVKAYRTREGEVYGIPNKYSVTYQINVKTS